VRECNDQPCPVDCKFEEWGPWSSCSVTCGYGVKRRARPKLEEQYGGKPCEGAGTEEDECSEEVAGCPPGSLTTSKPTTTEAMPAPTSASTPQPPQPPTPEAAAAPARDVAPSPSPDSPSPGPVVVQSSGPAGSNPTPVPAPGSSWSSASASTTKSPTPAAAPAPAPFPSSSGSQQTDGWSSATTAHSGAKRVGPTALATALAPLAAVRLLRLRALEPASP